VCGDLEGACVAALANQGGPCDDGVYCTVNDTCTLGACVGGPRDCSALSGPCLRAVCDESMSTCVAVTIDEGLSCDDGQFCTNGEYCTVGSCGGGWPNSCDDGSICTADSCDPSGQGCVGVPINEGASCWNGLFCTVGELCASGACVSGVPRSCDDGTACSDDWCDESGDTCRNDWLGPNPGAEGPPGDPTCADGLDNDCDRQPDLLDGSCVAGDPGVTCGAVLCVDPEICCYFDPVVTDPYCTLPANCQGLPVACDGPEECPDNICCANAGLSLSGDPPVGGIDGEAACEDSCPYYCDTFGYSVQGRACQTSANCPATEPHCCTGEAFDGIAVCLDDFCVASFERFLICD